MGFIVDDLQQSLTIKKAIQSDSCIAIILKEWILKTKCKILFTVQADNIRAIACFLVQSSGVCKKDCRIVSTVLDFFAVINCRQHGKRAAESVLTNISAHFKIERRTDRRRVDRD